MLLKVAAIVVGARNRIVRSPAKRSTVGKLASFLVLHFFCPFVRGDTSSLVDTALPDSNMVNTSPAPAQLQRKRKSAALHRCRFPDWSPSAITAITISPPTFATELLAFGGQSAERGVLGVARASGDVELMCWGGHQGWIAWRVRIGFPQITSYRLSRRVT